MLLSIVALMATIEKLASSLRQRMLKRSVHSQKSMREKSPQKIKRRRQEKSNQIKSNQWNEWMNKKKTQSRGYDPIMHATC